ncbi:MAG TPA: (deoxy)nucleoside triphosphate pyrophosphohydrolase [Staphylococcus sp.]|nr:(deoxy)nucleoside triphosphate pyrophosphohydrolase [Staphylococcus sp.]
MKKKIKVVAAVIFSGNKVLCAQRNNNMTLPFLWEFPGGKVEYSESEINALKREIREEMLCDIEIENKITTTEYEYDFGIVTLSTYKCIINQKSPTLTEHKEIKWLSVQDLDELDWAPADIPTVKILMNKL